LSIVPKGGFTLLEVLVAAVLLGVGIAAVLGGYSSIAQDEMRAREKEKMQQLAVDKFNELRAMTSSFTASDNGDFSDRGEPDLEWNLDVEPSGVQNLNAITVMVSRRNASDTSPESAVTELVFDYTAASAGATQTGGAQ
jgi:prepilin-type N-terminal cleavage/methylation domain-containing protein